MMVIDTSAGAGTIPGGGVIAGMQPQVKSPAAGTGSAVGTRTTPAASGNTSTAATAGFAAPVPYGSNGAARTATAVPGFAPAAAPRGSPPSASAASTATGPLSRPMPSGPSTAPSSAGLGTFGIPEGGTGTGSRQAVSSPASFIPSFAPSASAPVHGGSTSASASSGAAGASSVASQAGRSTSSGTMTTGRPGSAADLLRRTAALRMSEDDRERGRSQAGSVGLSAQSTRDADVTTRPASAAPHAASISATSGLRSGAPSSASASAFACPFCSIGFDDAVTLVDHVDRAHADTTGTGSGVPAPPAASLARRPSAQGTQLAPQLSAAPAPSVPATTASMGPQAVLNGPEVCRACGLRFADAVDLVAHHTAMHEGESAGGEGCAVS